MRQILSTLRLAVVAALVSFVASSTLSAATLNEGFEKAKKTSYAAGDLEGDAGTWLFTDALASNDNTNDKVIGTNSARIKNANGSFEMKFDKANGAGVITVNHAMYGTHTGGTWKLEISTDGGATYTQVGEEVTTVPSAMTPITFTANKTGNIRIKITKTSTKSSSTVNFDGISITDYTGGGILTPEITAPATLAFSNVSTGNTEPKAITVSGANLTGDVTVAVAGEGFTCSTTTITKAEATAGKEITVTFAPTAVKDYSGTITLTSPGATEKVINLTGSGIDATYPIAANIAALKGKGIDDKTTEFTITGELTFVYRNGRNVFFKDATGGLLVYDNNPAVITTAYQEGDVISGMKGKIASYNGLFEFIPTQDPGAKVRNTGAVTPVEVSAADLKANIAQYESQLVKLSNMTFESGKSFAADKASNINMTNGATTIVCRDGFSQLLGKTPPATANVVGFATPYVIGTTNDVQVFPRGEGDIMSTVSVIAPTAKPSVWANAVSGVVTIHSAKAAQVEIYNIVGKKVASQAIEGTVNVRLERGVYIVKVNGQSIKVKN